ncbi:hypothetical protein E1B28_010059 [Marasmius oreades]|uniref:PinX1-related protein 1 n=1 Tax=Marasmius oreades TaxID=181124 RepID=A0A9P7UQR1_9AGAR|nr:uncharacterized protein E1B28_010059 [Marasmius oreades]KAG7090992.1 hypothetical protein E1B28_010059 [Marasmius oreades]
MGLARRKVKQRIDADPRNLTWADDASKFGATYLAKFGWSSSQGLGVSGEGRTSHIKVSQKLDMLGIGAAQSKDPNGIAWKQNREFENLLKRLNANNGAAQTQADEATPEHEEEKDEDKKESKKERKKRKREEGTDEKKKKRKTSKDETREEAKEDLIPTETPVPKAPIVPRHRAHRARHIAAKRMASKSASAISEILGISSTSTSSATTAVATPTGSLTPIDSEPTLEKLTISTKSVSDYFLERLSTRTSGITAASTRTSAATHENTARGGLGSLRRTSNDGSDDEDRTPRGGLGANQAQFHNSDRRAKPG